AEPGLRLPVLRKLENRLRDGKARLPRGHRRQPLAVADRIGQVAALHFCELRFVVEQIELRGSAALEQINDAFRFRSEVRQALQATRRARSRALREQIGLQQFCKGGRPDPDACLPEKTPPGHTQWMWSVFARVHGYSFITVSFRLRIRLVTVVYAASSLTSSRVSRGCSPVLTYFRVASVLALNDSRFFANASSRISISVSFARRAVATRNA